MSRLIFWGTVGLLYVGVVLIWGLFRATLLLIGLFALVIASVLSYLFLVLTGAYRSE